MSRSLYARLHRRFGPRLSGEARQAKVRRHVDGMRGDFAIESLAVRAPRSGGPRVAVIGAGFAGLTAAYRLSFDCQVAVYEARARVGGRVWTLRDLNPGGLIEGGAELIGYNHARWLMLNEQFELGLSVLTGEDDYAAMGLDLPMRLHGHDLTPDELKRVYDEMTDAFNDMSYQAREVDVAAPWRTPNAAALDNRPLSDWIAGLPCSELTKWAIEAQFANNNGAPSLRQSWLANLALVAGGAMADDPSAFFTESETVRCSSGNDGLATALAGRIADNGGEVRLSSSCDGVFLDTTPPSLAVDGYYVEADYVVLAVPPSCWPNMRPAIPAEDAPTMGVVVKYLSDMAGRFWFAEKQAPSSVCDDYGMTWEGSDNQIGREPELSLFAGGDAAQTALDIWERDPGGLDRYYATQIDAVYPAYEGRRAGAPRFMPWPREPWTMTGYSCPKPGDVMRIEGRLMEPFGPNGALYFAGEHTSPGFFGYMEGALESGWRAAGQILARI